MPSSRCQIMPEVCLQHPSRIQVSIFKSISHYYGYNSWRLPLLTQRRPSQGIGVYIHWWNSWGAGWCLFERMSYKKGIIYYHNLSKYYRHPSVSIQRKSVHGKRWFVYKLRSQRYTDLVDLLLYYLDGGGIEERKAPNHNLHVLSFRLCSERSSDLCPGQLENIFDCDVCDPKSGDSTSIIFLYLVDCLRHYDL